MDNRCKNNLNILIDKINGKTSLITCNQQFAQNSFPGVFQKICFYKTFQTICFNKNC